MSEVKGLDPRLDYKSVADHSPSYKLQKLKPMSGGDTATISTAGGQETMIEIAPRAVNWSQSKLTFDVLIPEVNTKFTFGYADSFSEIRQIQLYTRGGMFLCDLDNLGNYTALLKACTGVDDVLTRDKFTVGATVAASTGLKEGMRASNILGLAGTAAATRYDNVASNVAYLEPQYTQSGVVGAGAQEGAIGYRVSYPLGALKRTVFAYDKDLYINETLIMRIVWAPTTKFSFTADDAAKATPVASAVAATIKNISLFVCQEQNDEIVNQLKSAASRPGGMRYVIPYIHNYKSAPGGTSQNLSLRMTAGHGQRLLSVMSAPFSATESKNTAFAHDNLAGGKTVTSFYVHLNDRRLHDFNIDCTTYEDWMVLKDHLQGSVLGLSSNVYQYNWTWIEDFAGRKHSIDKVDDKAGLSLKKGDQKVDIYYTTLAGDWNHYSYVEVQRDLIVSPSGVLVD